MTADVNTKKPPISIKTHMKRTSQASAASTLKKIKVVKTIKKKDSPPKKSKEEEIMERIKADAEKEGIPIDSNVVKF